MSASKSGNTTHDNNGNKQEAILQAAAVPGASATTVRAANATFHQQLALSAIANGVSPTVFLDAMRSLGKSLYP